MRAPSVCVHMCLQTHHTAPHLTSHPSIVHHTTPPSPPAPFLLCPSCLAVAALPTNGGMVTPGDMTPGAQNFYRGGYNMTSGGAAGMAVLQVGRAAAMAVLQGGGGRCLCGGGRWRGHKLLLVISDPP